MDAADRDEVLVSRTVKEIAAGSGLQLDDRGGRRLKGIDEPWRLYRVAS